MNTLRIPNPRLDPVATAAEELAKHVVDDLGPKALEASGEPVAARMLRACRRDLDAARQAVHDMSWTKTVALVGRAVTESYSIVSVGVAFATLAGAPARVVVTEGPKPSVTFTVVGGRNVDALRSALQGAFPMGTEITQRNGCVTVTLRSMAGK